MEQVIGIDIGTTRCCCSYMKGNTPSTIKTSTDSSLTPSVVSILSEDKIIVGEAAMNHMEKGIGDTVYATKRLIGRLYDDKQVEEDIRIFTYAVKRGLDNKPIIVVEVNETELHFTPVDICTFILKQMKEDAEKNLNNEVKKAVICVPAYFKDEQRKDTKFAAEKAGFEVLRIVNEPTAAAIAYSFNRITAATDKVEEKNKTLLVYDLGGGTFDVSIIRIEGSEINVIATGGDSHLGGEDFTNSIVEEVKQLHENNTGDVIKRKKDLIRLKKTCETAKITLSDITEVDVFVKDENYTISRRRFTELNNFLFEKTIRIVNETLDEVKIRKEEIDDVILIGGSSKMPQIPDYIIREFPRAKICKDINPDEAVSQGAAIVANEILYNNLRIVRDEVGEYMMVNNEIKLDEDEYSVIIDYHNHKGNVNNCVVIERDGKMNLKDSPCEGDEIVIPSLKYRPIVNDILSHSIGYEVQYDNDRPKMHVIIKKNEKIPVKKENKFKTIYDNQSSIPVQIYEGEDEYTENNTKLDEFDIPKIPKLPKGEYIVNFVTEINENGILEINVFDKKGDLLALHRTDVTNRSSFK